MNRNLLVVGIVIVVLFGFGAYLFVANQNKTPEVTTQPQTVEKESSKSSLRSLLGLRTNQMCTYSMEEGVEGKVFISDKKMRGDFTINTEGKNVSHVIVDGNTMYAWTEGERDGFKMTFDPDTFDKDASASAQSNVDLDKEFDFKCVSWTVDNDVFVPPAEVNFRSFSAPSIPTANCSVCENLSGDAKSQCLKALKC